MRRQLGVATAPLAAVLAVLLGGPVLFVTWPDLAAQTLWGLALTWLLVGGAVLVVSVTALVAVRYSERLENGVR